MPGNCWLRTCHYKLRIGTVENVPESLPTLLLEATAMARMAAAEAPRPFLWTREQYYRLAELGYFRSQRVMLIAGEIFTMSPQNEPHARSISLTAQATEAAFGPGFYARVQMPLDIGQASGPEPDVAVVVGSPRTNTTRPASAVLVVEVADSSLAFDTGEKGSLYAAADIADYWVIDLPHRRLWLFRGPHPDPTGPFGARYTHHLILSPTETVAPLEAPTRSITVGELLP